MIKIFDDGKKVEYSISCPDFNKNFELEKFGVIEINLLTGEYVHKDNCLWEKNKIYPIKLMEIPLEQRKELSQTKYKDYSSGRWAIHIFNFIKNCLKTKEFPDEKELIS
jgi:hypothetical protein